MAIRTVLSVGFVAIMTGWLITLTFPISPFLAAIVALVGIRRAVQVIWG